MADLRIDWSIPPLDQADQRLADVYRGVNRALDDLPYTEDFDRLCRLAGVETTDESRHQVFRRLLRRRKMSRLPRLGLLID